MLARRSRCWTHWQNICCCFPHLLPATSPPQLRPPPRALRGGEHTRARHRGAMRGAAVNMHSQGVVQGRVGGKRTWSTRSCGQREASSGSPSPAPSPSAAATAPLLQSPQQTLPGPHPLTPRTATSPQVKLPTPRKGPAAMGGSESREPTVVSEGITAEGGTCCSRAGDPLREVKGSAR